MMTINNIIKRMFPVVLLFVLLTSFGNTESKIDSEVKVLTRERQGGQEYKDDLKKAWRAFDIGDTRTVHELFTRVSEKADATDAEKVQALFGLATNYQFAIPKGKPDKAREYFQRIVDEHPKNTVAAWALLKLGILEGSADLEARNRAKVFYQRVRDEYPTSLAIHEATLRIAMGYFFDMEPEQVAIAIEMLEKHMKDYPDNPLASIMLFRLSYWYSEIERDYEKSIKHGLVLGEMKMADPQRWGMQFWGVAQTLRYRLNQPEEAIKWYQKIIDDCPRYYLVLPARRAIAELTEQLKNKPQEKE
jgi:tetratricopeptide (TPR) repeat protein